MMLPSNSHNLWKGYLTYHSHSVTNLRYTNAVDKKPHKEEEEVEMARAPPKEGP